MDSAFACPIRNRYFTRLQKSRKSLRRSIVLSRPLFWPFTLIDRGIIFMES